nr:centromere-associated protein E-like [Procambarus clarkii]
MKIKLSGIGRNLLKKNERKVMQRDQNWLPETHMSKKVKTKDKSRSRKRAAKVCKQSEITTKELTSEGSRTLGESHGSGASYELQGIEETSAMETEVKTTAELEATIGTRLRQVEMTMNVMHENNEERDPMEAEVKSIGTENEERNLLVSVATNIELENKERNFMESDVRSIETDNELTKTDFQQNEIICEYNKIVSSEEKTKEIDSGKLDIDSRTEMKPDSIESELIRDLAQSLESSDTMYRKKNIAAKVEIDSERTIQEASDIRMLGASNGSLEKNAEQLGFYKNNAREVFSSVIQAASVEGSRSIDDHLKTKCSSFLSTSRVCCPEGNVNHSIETVKHSNNTEQCEGSTSHSKFNVNHSHETVNDTHGSSSHLRNNVQSFRDCANNARDGENHTKDKESKVAREVLSGELEIKNSGVALNNKGISPLIHSCIVENSGTGGQLVADGFMQDFPPISSEIQEKDNKWGLYRVKPKLIELDSDEEGEELLRYSKRLKENALNDSSLGKEKQKITLSFNSLLGESALNRYALANIAPLQTVPVISDNEKCSISLRPNVTDDNEGGNKLGTGINESNMIGGRIGRVLRSSHFVIESKDSKEIASKQSHFNPCPKVDYLHLNRNEQANVTSPLGKFEVSTELEKLSENDASANIIKDKNLMLPCIEFVKEHDSSQSGISMECPDILPAAIESETSNTMISGEDKDVLPAAVESETSSPMIPGEDRDILPAAVESKTSSPMIPGEDRDVLPAAVESETSSPMIPGEDRDILPAAVESETSSPMISGEGHDIYNNNNNNNNNGVINNTIEYCMVPEYGSANLNSYGMEDRHLGGKYKTSQAQVILPEHITERVSFCTDKDGCAQLPGIMEGDLNPLLTARTESVTNVIPVNEGDRECIPQERDLRSHNAHLGFEQDFNLPLELKGNDDHVNVETECNNDEELLKTECYSSKTISKSKSNPECCPVKEENTDSVPVVEGSTVGANYLLLEQDSDDVHTGCKRGAGIGLRTKDEEIGNLNFMHKKHSGIQSDTMLPSVLVTNEQEKQNIGQDYVSDSEIDVEDSLDRIEELAVHIHPSKEDKDKLTDQCFGKENSHLNTNISAVCSKEKNEQSADNDNENESLALGKCQEEYDTQENLMNVMRDEIKRLELELKNKDEELRRRQEKVENDIKGRREISEQCDSVKFDDELKEERKIAQPEIKNEGLSSDHRKTETEERKVILEQPHEIIAALRQLVLQKEFKINQLLGTLSCCQNMFKLRDIIINQQVLVKSKIEHEAVQREACIKQLESEVKMAENKVKKCEFIIHNQQEQLQSMDKWGDVKYVKQLEEQLGKSQETLSERDFTICQLNEKLIQMRNAAVVDESLNNKLQRDLEVAQHTILQKESQIHHHQVFCSQMENDVQQKEANAVRLNQELDKCKKALSQKEDYIRNLNAEQSAQIRELEERLASSFTILEEKNGRINEIQRDLITLQKAVKDKENNIHSLKEQLNCYKNTCGKLEIASPTSSSSVASSYSTETQQKYQERELSQTHAKDKIASKNVIKDEYYKISADHYQILKKKVKQLNVATERIKELEQEVLYLTKHLMEDSVSTDKQNILELMIRVSELKRCIISREQMNGQLEERLKLQEDFVNILKNHLTYKNSILVCLLRRCSTTNTSVGISQEEIASRLKSVERKLEQPGEPEGSVSLKVGHISSIQDASQEISQEPGEQIKLEPSNLSVNQKFKEIKGDADVLVKQEPTDIHPSTSKQRTGATGIVVCNPSAKIARETSPNKKGNNCGNREEIRNLQRMKITLSEYRVRHKVNNYNQDSVEQCSSESCDSEGHELGIKRKCNEVEGPEALKHDQSQASKFANLQKKRRLLSRENFLTDIHKKNRTEFYPRPNTENCTSTVRETCATSALEQDKKRRLMYMDYKRIKLQPEGHSYPLSHSKKQEVNIPEVLKLKAALDHIKVKNYEAITKAYEDKLKLEGEASQRERIMAELVKEILNFEIQLRNSDTALAIIENDRTRIYSLLEHFQTELEETKRAKDNLSDLIHQNDDALEVANAEMAKLQLTIKQDTEEHEMIVEKLKSVITLKEVNISELQKQNEKLEESVKDKEDLLSIIGQMKEDINKKTSQMEILRCEKDVLIKDIKEIKNNQMQEMDQLEATLQQKNMKLKTLEEENIQSKNKLMESKAQLNTIMEEKGNIEEILKKRELDINILQEKGEIMEIALAEKTTELLRVQEELSSIQKAMEREEANVKAVLIEKQKLEEALQQQTQILSEHDQEKQQKELMFRNLQETMISERNESELMRKQADDTLASKEQEILLLKKDKEQLGAEIQLSVQKHLKILSEKDTYWTEKLDFVNKDLDEVVKVNTGITNQLESIKETRSLIRKELKISLPPGKALNLRQELDAVCKLNNIIKEEKKKTALVNRELLEEKSKITSLQKQLQIVRREKSYEKRNFNKNQILVNQECQTESSLVNEHLESNKNLQTALETEKRVSENFYEQLLQEQTKSKALANGLKQEYEETSKDLEYQLSLFCWIAEKYRNKMRRLEELSASSTSGETVIDEGMSP